MSVHHVYLAGPDVFRPDASVCGRHLQTLCAEFGFVGIFPTSDSAVDEELRSPAQARGIYLQNLALIESADAVLANLAFFRGAEPDSGTCFEVGFAIARGKIVVGYVPEEGSYLERVRRRYPSIIGRDSLDCDGWHIEDFKLPVNLMLAVPCRVVVGDARAAVEALRDEMEA